MSINSILPSEEIDRLAYIVKKQPKMWLDTRVTPLLNLIKRNLGEPSIKYYPVEMAIKLLYNLELELLVDNCYFSSNKISVLKHYIKEKTENEKKTNADVINREIYTTINHILDPRFNIPIFKIEQMPYRYLDIVNMDRKKEGLPPIKDPLIPVKLIKKLEEEHEHKQRMKELELETIDADISIEDLGDGFDLSLDLPELPNLDVEL